MPRDNVTYIFIGNLALADFLVITACLPIKVRYWSRAGAETVMNWEGSGGEVGSRVGEGGVQRVQAEEGCWRVEVLVEGWGRVGEAGVGQGRSSRTPSPPRHQCLSAHQNHWWSRIGERVGPRGALR